MRAQHFLCIVMLLLASTQVYAANNDTPSGAIYVNTGFKEPVATILQRVTEELFKRMELPLQFQRLPAERSLQRVNEGIDDMECCRKDLAATEHYPNLMAVPESVYQVRITAFTANPSVRITNWEELKPYTVGVVRGYKHPTAKLTQLQHDKIVTVDKPSSLIHMLNKGRVDVAVLHHEDGMELIQRFQYHEIVAQRPPLAQFPIHLMIHKKHQAMLERLSATILQMKIDGTIDSLAEQVMEQERQNTDH